MVFVPCCEGKLYFSALQNNVAEPQLTIISCDDAKITVRITQEVYTHEPCRSVLTQKVLRQHKGS